jgi:hypothetical protein
MVAGSGNGWSSAGEGELGARCSALADDEKKVLSLESRTDGYRVNLLQSEDWTVVCDAETTLDARSDFLGMVARVHIRPPESSERKVKEHLREIGLREMRTMGEAGMPIKNIEFLEAPRSMVTYLVDVPGRGRAMNMWLAQRRSDGSMVELQLVYLPQPSHPSWLRDDPVGGLELVFKSFELASDAQSPDPDDAAPAPGKPAIERPRG